MLFKSNCYTKTSGSTQSTKIHAETPPEDSLQVVKTRHDAKLFSKPDI